MKKIFTGIFAALMLAMASTVPAAADFKIGPKVGISVNRFSTNKDVFSSDNRVGFTAGVSAEFTVPLIGVGADVSVLYARREAEMVNKTNDVLGATNATAKIGYNYISIPLHLKYKLSLPAINRIIVPFAFTGPDFAFRCGKSVVKDFKANKYNIGWDFGLGVELIRHLQISAGYTLGISKAIVPVDIEDPGIKGRTDGWTITAAWMF